MQLDDYYYPDYLKEQEKMPDDLKEEQLNEEFCEYCMRPETRCGCP